MSENGEKGKKASPVNDILYHRKNHQSNGERPVMKKYLDKFLTAAVIAALLLTATPFAAEAAGSIYVNDSSGMLSGGISGAYAIGGSGSVSALPNTYAYALTGSGLTTVGTSAVVIPDHLGVSGSIAVPYSKVRVGLYYYDASSSVRNPTLESANLENSVGSGYLFGYYDSERNFHQVGYTAETRLTMVMDKNVDTAGGHVGCYHIMLGGTYQSFDQALAAASAYPDGFPAYYNGTYYALAGAYDSSADAAADAAARGIVGTAYSASGKCVAVTRTSDARILFEFDCGTSANLAVSPRSTSGKAVTWFKGYKYYGDFEYVRRTGEKLTVINVVELEDYVKGILPYEMNAAWPVEALKAQAVCARTYVANNFGTYSAAYGFDVTNDTYCQAYRGTTLATSNSDSAVDATAGQYITYGGKTISATYYSSNGGGSESSENVFGGYLAYQRGKTDPFEAKSDSINGKSSWTFTYTKEQLGSIIKATGVNMSAVTSVDITYSDSGNAVGIVFRDASGHTATYRQDVCYKFCTGKLGLYSIHFTVQDTGSAFVFTGGGWGHSVGMSQFGAYAMAKYYGYTYDQIISFYYTGVSLSAG